MIEICIEIGDVRHSHQVPTCWDDVTQEQFLCYIAHQKPTDTRIKEPVLFAVMGFSPEEQEALMPADKFYLSEQLLWMNERGIDALCMEAVTLPDGTVCHGYLPDFSNTTWGEFINADFHASRGDVAAFAAMLYRPHKAVTDSESDKRIDFSLYGATDRYPKFQQLDKLTLEALFRNYIALRRRNISDMYPQIFPPVDEDEEEEEVQPRKKRQPLSWLSVHEALMAENFFHEKEFLALPVHTVLRRYNHCIKEAKRRKK